MILATGKAKIETFLSVGFFLGLLSLFEPLLLVNAHRRRHGILYNNLIKYLKTAKKYHIMMMNLVSNGVK